MSYLCWNCNLIVWCLLKCFYEFLFCILNDYLCDVVFVSNSCLDCCEIGIITVSQCDFG